MRVIQKEVEKVEKLEEINRREMGKRIFQNNLVRLPARLRAL